MLKHELCTPLSTKNVYKYSTDSFFLLYMYSMLRTGSDPKRMISLEIHSTQEAIREQQRM